MSETCFGQCALGAPGLTTRSKDATRGSGTHARASVHGSMLTGARRKEGDAARKQELHTNVGNSKRKSQRKVKI